MTPNRFDTISAHLMETASVAKSLADENRLRILLSIAAGKKTVSKIVEEVGLSQPLVSHHLKELRRTSLVDVERNGVFIHYQIRNIRILTIIEMLHELTDTRHPPANTNRP